MIGRLAALALACVLLVPACGDGDGPHVETGICARRPCLTHVDNDADWAVISQPHAPDGRCDFLEESKFIAPAIPSAALQEVVFQDVHAHQLHLDFMTQVLPELFGGLSPEMYRQIVQQHATRQYWAGVLYRLVDEDGTSPGYGFDVVHDYGFDELPTEAEIIALAAQLSSRLHRPLFYAPVDSSIEATVSSYQTPVHLRRACNHVACATAGVDCVVIPEAASLCGQFTENRDLETELANKVRLPAAAMTIEVPPGVGTYQVPAIFGVGEAGAARTPVMPAGATGTYSAGATGGETSRGYSQELTIGGVPYRLNLRVDLPDEGGGFLLDTFTVGVPYFGSLSGGGGLPEWIGSCTGDGWERWQIRADLGGGDRFTIDYRRLETFFASRPWLITRGEVTLGGVTTVVDDYFRLVYAGKHHNFDNQFWILFDAPVTYQGHPVYGFWLDQADLDGSTFESAHTLDADRHALDDLGVTGYVVERLP